MSVMPWGGEVCLNDMGERSYLVATPGMPVGCVSDVCQMYVRCMSLGSRAQIAQFEDAEEFNIAAACI